MGWKNFFKDLTRIEKEKEKQRKEIGEKEMERAKKVFREFGPRIEMVCSEFSKETGWKFERSEESYGTTPSLWFSIKKNNEYTISISLTISGWAQIGVYHNSRPWDPEGDELVNSIWVKKFSEKWLAKQLANVFIQR